MSANPRILKNRLNAAIRRAEKRVVRAAARWAYSASGDKETQSLLIDAMSALVLADAPEQCRTCAEPLRWEQTERGPWLPLNPEPVPSGDIVVERDNPEGDSRMWGFFARVLAVGETAAERFEIHVCEETP